MTPAKPTARDIKKQFQDLQSGAPQGAGPARALAALANSRAAIDGLADAFPQAPPAELRRFLASIAALMGSLEAWSGPAPREEASAAKTASPPPPALNDPSVLALHARVKVHVDGASKGNPGPSAVGVVVTDLEGIPLFEDARYLGEMTNNSAEYFGLIHALEILIENDCREAFFFSDSQLMVRQMNLEYKVKHPGIKPLFTQAQRLKRRLKRFQIVHVTRDKNERADRLANLAIKQARDAAARQDLG